MGDTESFRTTLRSGRVLGSVICGVVYGRVVQFAYNVPDEILVNLLEYEPVIPITSNKTMQISKHDHVQRKVYIRPEPQRFGR